MMILTRAFWNFALERAVKTAAQSAALVVGASAIGNGISIDALNPFEIAYFAAGGFVLSVLTSVATAKTTTNASDYIETAPETTTTAGV